MAKIVELIPPQAHPLFRGGPPPDTMEPRFGGKEPTSSHLNSDYRTTYVDCPRKRVDSIRPLDNGALTYDPEKPIDPNTLYHIHYYACPRKRVPPIKPVDNGKFTYDPSKPIDPNTLYTAHYRAHQKEANIHKKPHKPTPKCIRPDTPEGDDLTSYNDQYRQKTVKIPEKCVPDPLDHRPTEGNQTNIKITVHKEKHRTFTEPEMLYARQGLFRPKDNIIFPPDERIEGWAQEEKKDSQVKKIHQCIYPCRVSTQKEDYKEHKLEKKGLYIPVRWDKPDIKFQNKTTSREEYKLYENKLHRPPSFKPIEYFYPPDHSLPAKQSSYRIDYKQQTDKDIRPRENQMAKRPPIPKKPKIQGETQYKDIYDDKSVDYQRPGLCRPKSFPRLGLRSDFPCQSMHRITFKEANPKLLKAKKDFLKYKKITDPKKNYAEESTAREAFKGTYGPTRDIIRPKVRDRLDFYC